MKKYAFHIAFAIGALSILWVAAAVASTHLLVLVMTAVIGAVYVYGAQELRHYRNATAQLQQALLRVPDDLEQLDPWLVDVPPSLQNAVRQRIEGERTALPGPAFTPYLVGLLVMLAAVLGRWKGVRAVVGAALSLAVLVWVIVPRLAGGGDVLPVVLLGTLGILCVTIYFVHGLGRKTTAALLGTAITATLGYLIALAASNAMGFTGTVSAGGYVASTMFDLNPVSVYLVGIIVGTVGALNDVTVTQAAVVQALAHENPAHRVRDLYVRAMQVGFDHIGSLINVLVLLYAATGIPLLLLLDRDPTPWWVKLSGEGFASEVTSILITSICLLLAVPLTTLIAARFFRGGRHAPDGHAHVH